ncbi:hypothetical protein ADK47_41560, partial [Streptomyces rimosus subsp. rimosus]
MQDAAGQRDAQGLLEAVAQPDGDEGVHAQGGQGGVRVDAVGRAAQEYGGLVGGEGLRQLAGSVPAGVGPVLEGRGTA